MLPDIFCWNSIASLKLQCCILYCSIFQGMSVFVRFKRGKSNKRLKKILFWRTSCLVITRYYRQWRGMRCVGAWNDYGREDKWLQGFVWKFYGKRPLGRLKHKWEDTIKMDYKEIGWKGIFWIYLPQDRN